MAKQKNFLAVTEQPIDYELNPEKGWFGVIVPSAKTNLITNPSVETNTTNYAAAGAGYVLARVATEQRRGIFSARVTPAAGVTGYLQYGGVGGIALAANTKYTWSFDFLGAPGETYYLDWQLLAAFAVLQRTIVTGDGHWHRYELPLTPTTVGPFILSVGHLASANLAPFYVDGMQLETGNATTYLDGDMVGFVLGQIDYRWNGTAHASTSYRTGQTRSGGEVMNLKNLGFMVMAFIGLGLAPVENISTQLAKGGEFYQDTIWQGREFSIMGVIEGKTLQEIQRIRSSLNAAFTPDATVEKQPLVIRYTPYDCGDQFGDTVDIQCSYSGGLEGNVNNLFQETIPLTFKQYMPFISRDGDNAIQLGYFNNINPVSSVVIKDGDTGVYSNVGITFVGSPYKIRKFYDGSYLIIGAFTTMNGVTYNRLLRWDGAAFYAYTVGVNIGVDGAIYDAVIYPDNTFIIVGAFVNAGGVACNGMAYWNGAAFAPYGAGFAGGTATGYAIVFDTDGLPIVGGNFNTANAVPNTVNLAKWTGATFIPYGTGTNGQVNEIMITKAGVMWIGGNFVTANGVTVNDLTYWNGVTFVQVISSIIGVGIVQCLIELNNNDLVIGGQFTSINGVVSRDILVWNGAEFIDRFSGGAGNPLGGILDFAYDHYNNILYVAGAFDNNFGGTMVGNQGVVRIISPTSSSSIVPLDFSMGVAPATFFYGIYFDVITRDVLFAHGGGGASVYTVTTTATNSWEASAYPRIIINGPGTIWSLENFTTGRRLYFNDLTLALGEIMTINLDPAIISLFSNVRPDLSGYLVSGSDLDWPLISGINYTALFMYGGTGATTDAYMIWQDGLMGLDGASW